MSIESQATSAIIQPKVRVVPLQPHCFAFGGFELQMIAAMSSVRDLAINIAPLDFWRREADFDLLHVWGLELQHRGTLEWAHKAGVRTVVTALVLDVGLRSWLRYIASFAAGPARLRRSMLRRVDFITVVNEAQRSYVIDVLGFRQDKVSAIPNIVEEIFYNSQTDVEGVCELERYVICTGNICRRKNQLALLRACKNLGLPLLLIGGVLTGEEEYARAIESELSDTQGLRWIRELPPGSQELATAYRRASVFALPSFAEQQPISALEAAASGKPLVLANRAYARQEYYRSAVLADPASPDSIAAALRKAIDSPHLHTPPAEVLERCRRSAVANAYVDVYRSVMRQG